MPNQYYKKDIHKSMETLLYGLYVYQYLLDTSTFGLLLRVLIQEQIVSSKALGLTLRLALYTVFGTNFLAILRHLNTPSRYAVIIDFIGNVSIPSRSKLLWLDVVIIVLQITMTLISFNVLKAGEGSRRTVPSTARSSRHSQTNNTSRARTSRPTSPVSDSMARSGGLSGSHPRFAAINNSNGSSSSSSSSNAPSVAPAESSSVLFDYTSQSGRNAGSSRLADTTAEYYVDDEEVRYSLDNPHSSRTQHPFRGPANQGSGLEQDHTSASDNSEVEEEEDDDNPLEDDYEGILEQETFVLQVQFKDLVGYLGSSQEAMSFSRISNLRTMGTQDAEATRVQNLPV